MVRVRPHQLEGAIQKALDDYKKIPKEALKKAQKEVATGAVPKLQASSPKRRPKYASSWKTKQTSNMFGEGYVIYNTEGQLTHLLEKGHLTRNGASRTRAIVHIEPVDQWVAKEFEGKVVRYIENG